jgi:hypothetical protein
MLVSKQHRAIYVALGVLSLFSATGCAVLPKGSSADNRWLQSGSLALSRPMPNPSRPTTPLEQASTGSATSSDSAALIISRRDSTLTAVRPGAAPLVIKTDGAQHLHSGSFSVTQKELDPLWYAPKEYFMKRALPIPPEGSRERFKRAALGSQTIYLNDQTPIHSGPVWMREIGGLRVNSSAMNELYSMIQVGTRVEVR